MNSIVLRVAEIAAVILNLLFTWLYLHGNVNCYWFGGVGSLIFVFLCFIKKIYADSVLQLFYVGFSIYGYMHFSEEWKTTTWSFEKHIPFLIAGIFCATAFAFALKKFTDAKLPWVDAPVAVFSIVATWIMVNYVHENWLYWIVIDSVSIFLYAKRGLWIGASLFALYLFMALDGYFKWQVL